MGCIDKLIDEYYEKFKGLPNTNPIVRGNQKNDAFELVVFETLYGIEKEVDIKNGSTLIVEELTKYIVAPPDDGVDIVVEHEDTDGNKFDFVQVKNKELDDLELKQIFLYMQDTAKKCSKSIEKVGINLKNVLSNTSFSSGDDKFVNYIVVHSGDKNYFKDQKPNWHVITLNDLELARENMNVKTPKVPCEIFDNNSFNGYISYEKDLSNPAILLNLRAYDLAKLSIKYASNALGRNVLYGQNLRDSLTSKSKTYEGMKDTIQKNPEKFWFYNNGITIIAEDFVISNEKNNKKIILKNFSIINGAQTTSSFGEFYKEMDVNRREEEIEKLKKVYVLARVLKVNDDGFRTNIAVYNNTQNEIGSRDMASIRSEQQSIYEKLIKGAPNIYMEYRRGMDIPSGIRIYKHQKTANDELAQLLYAGIDRDPFNAKNKKKTLFNHDSEIDEDIILNNNYDHIFSPNNGLLFSKTKEEIDELLFVYFLYKESKKLSIREYKEQIKIQMKALENETDELKKEKINSHIEIFNLQKAINNVCAFYCLDYYYAVKELVGGNSILKLNYNKYYSDKNYQKQIVEDFNRLFLVETVKLIKDCAKLSSLNTWVRDKKSTESFNEKADEHITGNFIDIKSKYNDFVAKHAL